MSWDVDEVEFYETFAEIAADPNRGLDGAKEWAWSALHWTQQELRERDKELQQERENVVRFLRQPPGKAKACDKPHRHEDGKPCLVLVPVDLDEAADLIEQGKHRIGSIDHEP